MRRWYWSPVCGGWGRIIGKFLTAGSYAISILPRPSVHLSIHPSIHSLLTYNQRRFSKTTIITITIDRLNDPLPPAPCPLLRQLVRNSLKLNSTQLPQYSNRSRWIAGWDGMGTDTTGPRTSCLPMPSIRKKEEGSPLQTAEFKLQT